MNLPDFFALDLGNHSIKLAQIKRDSDTSATLLKVGSLASDTGLLSDDSEAGIKKLAEEIKKAKENAQITTTNCVAAVPESPIFSRLLTIPKVEPAKLTETVHWELKPLIPVPLEEVDLAFLEVGESQVGTQTMLDIYVVAAPKALTNKFKKVAELAGINLLALETESLANTRALGFNYPTLASGDVVICDFGAFSTDLILARNSVPIFVQTIGTGSDALTKAIAADYGLDLAQAEKYKRAFGLSPDQGEGKIAKSLEPIMQILITEMSRAFTYFKQKSTTKAVADLYMCGDAALLPNLSAYFQDKLGVTVTIADPLQKISIASGLKDVISTMSRPGLSVAVGLGLKQA